MEINVILIYGLLMFSVVSIWVQPKFLNRIPLWSIFLIVSFILAILFGRASFLSLSYSLIFGSSIYYYYKKKSILFFLLTLGLSIPLILHFSFLGFNNYRYIENVSLTNNSTPYSLYFNLDKTFVGVLIIAFSFENKKIEFIKILKLLFINLLLMGVIFAVLIAIFGYSKFEPKLPYFIPVWILVNLFFTCMAEEALFRKLIQQKIYDLVDGKYASIVSVLVASIAFGLAHFNGGISYIILASLAGIFYGYIYYKTKRIESSILLHFLFNLIHILLFTYPALK